MREPLKDWIIYSAKAAARAFEAGHELPCPLWQGLTFDNLPILIPIPPWITKDEATQMVREIFAEKHVTRCLFVAEAWVMTGGEDLRALYDAGDTIEDHPNRGEAIIFMAEDVFAGTLCAHMRITRGRKGQARLEPLEFLPHNTFEGRLHNMIPKPS